MEIERKRALDTSLGEEIPQAAEKQLKFLSTGDEILYKDNIYKVEGHLKQGRLRMSQMPSGIHFSLSSADPLYAALLAEKLGQSSSVSLIVPKLQNAPEYNIFQNLKR